jgi:hypothetical protein
VRDSACRAIRWVPSCLEGRESCLGSVRSEGWGVVPAPVRVLSLPLPRSPASRSSSCARAVWCRLSKVLKHSPYRFPSRPTSWPRTGRWAARRRSAPVGRTARCPPVSASLLWRCPHSGTASHGYASACADAWHRVSLGLPHCATGGRAMPAVPCKLCSAASGGGAMLCPTRTPP